MKETLLDEYIVLELSRSSNGLHIYTLFKRGKHPLGDVLRSVAKLEKEGFIELSEEEHASLSVRGRDYAQKVAASVTERSSKPWKKVPKDLQRTSLSDDLDFYVPRLSLLSRKFFG